MIRVAIVADSTRLRRELSDLLCESRRVEVIASVSALDEVSEQGSELLDAVDVVLTDATPESAPNRASSSEVASERHSEAPSSSDESALAWVVLSDDEQAAPPRTFRPGLALLPTSATTDQILAAVEAVAAGLIVLHADQAGGFNSAPVDDPLTPREREVLHMLAAGCGNKEIANRLHISDHTAKFHVSQILAKLDAATRAEAVSIAMRRGLVPL